MPVPARLQYAVIGVDLATRRADQRIELPFGCKEIAVLTPAPIFIRLNKPDADRIPVQNRMILSSHGQDCLIYEVFLSNDAASGTAYIVGYNDMEIRF